MESNFNFLSNEWKIIYERARSAEQFAKPDIRASFVFARMALEITVKFIYEKDYDLENRRNANLDELINNLDFSRKLGNSLKNKIIEIKTVGNNAVHNNKLNCSNPIVILKNLFEFEKWFCSNYSENQEKIDIFFNDKLISNNNSKVHSNEEIKNLEKKLTLENKLEIEKFQFKIQKLELEIIKQLKKINEQEEELLGLKKLLDESKAITTEYTNLQSKDKKNENYYSFQIQEIGITEQCDLIWGRVFINFVFNNEQYFAVKYFAINNKGDIDEKILIAKGKFQDSKMYKIFNSHHNNLNFKDILNKKYDHLELLKKYDKKRFGTPSILLKKLLLDLKKQFAFKFGDSEYVENGYYKFDNKEYMSIWAFKNNYMTKSENITEQNYLDANKLYNQKTPYFKSKPDYGYFNEIKIYLVNDLKMFYKTEIKKYESN